MPNHVFNSIVIESNTKEAIDAFIAKANSSYQFAGKKWDYSGDKPVDLGIVKEIRSQEFSFNAFVRVPVGGVGYNESYGKDGKLHQPWYEWNVENWGTKWDAYDIEIDRQDDEVVLIRFSTAWAPPLPVFIAMVKQHPELKFDFEWEEEGGWGGKAIDLEGEFAVMKEWDVPNSHADFDALDKECDACAGWYPDDPTEWYDDCPNKAEKLKEKSVGIQ